MREREEEREKEKSNNLNILLRNTEAKNWGYSSVA
jgi:hypothetical protein